LLFQTSVKASFRKGHAITHALVVSSTLRKFLGIDHLTPTASAAALGHIDKIFLSMRHLFCTLLHFDVKNTDCFTVFIRFTCVNRGSNLQQKILKKQNIANFANNRYQIYLFCQQLVAEENRLVL